jgi:hypothetical protein
VSGARYFELYVPCPRCPAHIEVAAKVAAGSVEVLHHDLCPNELGPYGHPLNTSDDLHRAVRSSLAKAQLI